MMRMERDFTRYAGRPHQNDLPCPRTATRLCPPQSWVSAAMCSARSSTLYPAGRRGPDDGALLPCRYLAWLGRIARTRSATQEPGLASSNCRCTGFSQTIRGLMKTKKSVSRRQSSPQASSLCSLLFAFCWHGTLWCTAFLACIHTVSSCGVRLIASLFEQYCLSRVLPGARHIRQFFTLADIGVSDTIVLRGVRCLSHRLLLHYRRPRSSRPRPCSCTITSRPA